MISIDCISDLHGEKPKLEGGDLLIIAGDLTAFDKDEQHYEFYDWMLEQNYEKIIFIGGNHDNYLQKGRFQNTDPKIVYLQEREFEYRGYKIYGSPWSAWFNGINPLCTAFTGDEDFLAEKFALIPDDVDILVTHTPPWGILDSTKPRYPDFKFKNLGSIALRTELNSGRIKPKLHVFGHIHESHGVQTNLIDFPYTTFVNAAQLDENYLPVNDVIQILLPEKAAVDNH